MSFLPAFLTRNWKLKLAALTLAILLWTSLRVEAPGSQVLPSVPVRIQLNDPQWSVRADPSPPAVQVRFSGPARDLLSLALERPTVTIPIDAVAGADSAVLIRSEWVRLPNRPNVTVEEIQPRQVTLFFEPFTQAIAPISIRTVGRLSDDISLTEPLTADPEVVRIGGPASQVEAVDSIPLEPLDLSEVEATGSRELLVDTTGLYGLVISPGRIRVDYTVNEVVERTFDDVPVVLGDGSSGIMIDPPSTSVTVRGARSLVEDMTLGSIWVEVPAAAMPELEVGESADVPVVVRGVPALVSGAPEVDAVTIRRIQAANP